MPTKFPAQIDDSSAIPPVVDNVTKVNASVINNLRDAIIAIETELGIKPSGTQSTVKSRLDAIETSVANIPTGGGSSTPTYPKLDATSPAVAPGDLLVNAGNGNLTKATQTTLSNAGGVFAAITLTTTNPGYPVPSSSLVSGTIVPASVVGVGVGTATDAVLDPSTMRITRTSTVSANSKQYGNIRGTEYYFGTFDAAGNLTLAQKPVSSTTSLTTFNPRLLVFGAAAGDGTTDDSAAIAACDAAANAAGTHATLSRGTYYVNSNITLAAHWTFEHGAILKPATGKTITLNYAPTAGQNQKIFEVGLVMNSDPTGGTIAFASPLPHGVSPLWWETNTQQLGPAAQAAALSLPNNWGTASGTGGLIQFPSGMVSLGNHLVWITQRGTTVAGHGRWATQVNSGGYFMAFHAASYPSATSHNHSGQNYFQAPLLTDTNPKAASLLLAGADSNHFDLTEDCSEQSVAGYVNTDWRELSACTWECAWQPTDFTQGYLLSSAGAVRADLADYSRAFCIGQLGNGTVQFTAQIAVNGSFIGPVLTSDGYALTAGHKYHLHGQFDGRYFTARIYDYSTSTEFWSKSYDCGTGTNYLVQRIHEVVHIGYNGNMSFCLNPDQVYQTSPYGLIDAVRVSSVARYPNPGTAFTPSSSRFAFDYSTLYLFQPTTARLGGGIQSCISWGYKGYTYGLTIESVHRVNGYISAHPDVTFEKMSIYQGGISTWCANRCRILCDFYAGRPYFGQNSYESIFEGFIQQNGVWGLVATNASGITARKVYISGSWYPILVHNRAVIHDCYIDSQSLVYGGVFYDNWGDDSTVYLRDFCVSDEGGSAPNEKAMVLIQGISLVEASMVLDCAGSSNVPPLADIYGCDVVKLNLLGKGGAIPQIVKISAPPTQPVELSYSQVYGSFQSPTTVYSNRPDCVRVNGRSLPYQPTIVTTGADNDINSSLSETLVLATTFAAADGYATANPWIGVAGLTAPTYPARTVRFITTNNEPLIVRHQSKKAKYPITTPTNADVICMGGEATWDTSLSPAGYRLLSYNSVSTNLLTGIHPPYDFAGGGRTCTLTFPFSVSGATSITVSITNAGAIASPAASGSTITFTIPAYTGTGYGGVNTNGTGPTPETGTVSFTLNGSNYSFNFNFYYLPALASGGGGIWGWYRYGHPSNTISGGLCSSIYDLTGQGRNATQATQSNQATYQCAGGQTSTSAMQRGRFIVGTNSHYQTGTYTVMPQPYSFLWIGSMVFPNTAPTQCMVEGTGGTGEPYVLTFGQAPGIYSAAKQRSLTEPFSQYPSYPNPQNKPFAIFGQFNGSSSTVYIYSSLSSRYTQTDALSWTDTFASLSFFTDTANQAVSGTTLNEFIAADVHTWTGTQYDLAYQIMGQIGWGCA